MKITKIDVFQVNSPDDPIWKPVLCRIYTDEGIYGDGEAAMAYGIASSGAFGMVQDLANYIMGMNPLENEVIWQKMYRSTFWGQNGGGVFTAAMSAIDIALWDIRGKYYNTPIYMLLGGKLRDNIRCYASQLQFGWQDNMGAMFSIDDYIWAAKEAVKQGYDCIKVDFLWFKPEGGKYSDGERTTLLHPKTMEVVLQRLKAMREAVGPYVDIIMENHSFTDAQSAVQLARAVEPYNIYYFEEPNTPDAQTAKYISEKTNIPIANGERIFTRWQYAKFFQNNTMQVAQPDIGTCGGITEVKKVCDLAYIYDVAVQVHACGSPLSTAAALHVEAAIPNFIIHEHHIVNLTPANKRLCKYDYQPENGKYKIPEKPGLGNELSDYVLNECTKVTIESNKFAW